jgi:hypothetical protein
MSMTMGGYGLRTEKSTGVHDPLYLRALYISGGTKAALLVICDLVAVGDDLVEILRTAISAELKISADKIMIAATHTHAGPAAVRNLLDPDYTKLLTESAVAAAKEAAKLARPARFVSKWIDVDGVSQNRRDPEYPIKEGLDLLVAIDGNRGVIASLIFYACHPTIMEFDNLEYSADFPGAAIQLVEENLGGQAIYLQGACGDINPTWSAHDWENVELNGRIVGSAALAAAYRALTLGVDRFAVNLSWAIDTPQVPVAGSVVQDFGLAVASEFITLVRRRPEDVEEDRDEIAELEGKIKGADLELRKSLQPRLTFLKAKRYGWTNPSPRYLPGSDNLEIQAIQLSDEVVILGLPGEYLIDFATVIEKRSPFKQTLIVCYANGYFDYFPLAKDFKEHGYEVGRSVYGEGSTERIVDSSLALLHRLQKQHG